MYSSVDSCRQPIRDWFWPAASDKKRCEEVGDRSRPDPIELRAALELMEAARKFDRIRGIEGSPDSHFEKSLEYCLSNLG